MKPILYDKGETDYSTLGIGPLTDCISCKCSQSEGSYELNFEYPITGVHADDIKVFNWVKVFVPPYYETSPQLFYIVKITKNTKQRLSVTCHHVSYRLKYIQEMPYWPTKLDGQDYGEQIAFFSNIKWNVAQADMYEWNGPGPYPSAALLPFHFDTDAPNMEIEYKPEYVMPIMDMLGGSDDSILGIAGGYYIWDNYDVHHKTVNPDRGFVIGYGKDIIDITQEENIENTYTGLVPYWHGSNETEPELDPEEEEETEEETRDASEESEETSNEKYVYLFNFQDPHGDNYDYVWAIPGASSTYPFSKTLAVDLTEEFEEEPTSYGQLAAAAAKWNAIHKPGEPVVSIDIDFIELSKTEEFKGFTGVRVIDLYDIVTVRFIRLGIDVKATITSISYDVLNERFETVHIGQQSDTMITNMQTARENIGKLWHKHIQNLIAIRRGR